LLKLAPRLLLLVAMLAAVLLYRPGLHGPFLFDDGFNIVENQSLRLQDFSKEELLGAAYSIPNGIFGRPLSMLSFSFNFYADRNDIQPFPSAYSFKATNLAIHLLNGVLVFLLTRLLVAFYRERRQPDLPASYPAWLALAVSAAWLLHPLNLTTVLYVVQRMTGLAAMFSFLGLGAYVWGRTRLCKGLRGGMPAVLSSLFVFTPLAFLSKENGLLLPLFILVTEAVLFRLEAARPLGRQFLIACLALLVILPGVLVAGYLALHPEFFLAGYGRREFTLPERLMTEARVVWFYLRQIVLPSTALMGVFHDDVAISRGLLDPVLTLPAIAGILALPIAVWFLRWRQPLVAFGIAFFLVGHGMESTVYPLELVHEHRNYLPMFGILLAFFHLLLTPVLAVSTRKPRAALAMLLIPLFAVGTHSRANDWSSPFSLWSMEVEHHPASIRANIALGDLYAGAMTFDPSAKAGNHQLAQQSYEQALAVNRYNVTGLFGLVELSKLHGKPIEKSWLADLKHGLENEPIPPGTNDNLIRLAMCKLQEDCPLQIREIDELVRAPLGNPRVTGRDRALIYNALTVYLFNIAKDYPAAVEAARHAIALDPADINHQLWLASIFIAMKRPQDASRQIAVIKQLDQRGIKRKDIEELETQLAGG
jgi:hypothetical protein